MQGQLVDAHRGLDLEGGHPGILADGALVLGGHVDIGGDDVEGLGSLGGGCLGLQAVRHGPPDVRRKVGGGLGDECENTLLKRRHDHSLKAGSGIEECREQEPLKVPPNYSRVARPSGKSHLHGRSPQSSRREETATSRGSRG